MSALPAQLVETGVEQEEAEEVPALPGGPVKISIEKAMAGTTEDLLSRVSEVSESFRAVSAQLHGPILRIEIDVEYADGGRVKLEGKA